ncbi:hypothetical protein D3093_26930 (plasmid) [Azospirillum argentinense]|uniref:Uncharacterized protein n=1 Tax=Azospirillum argentinense TaxID=2970906 RepID=A0A4D8PL08_9PROT|nr:hypothetical protein [Azospirillum argentinense]QCN98922.1 hypothetical protein D3093_26930 [Azospirillum argentinense]
MLRSSDILDDRYRRDRYLRLWELVDGLPRCRLDALDTSVASEQEIAAVEARNHHLAHRLAVVEAFEVAQAQLARMIALGSPPPETVPSFGPDGLPAAKPNPEWVAWQAALDTVQNADNLTRAYALVRLGRPEEPAVGDEPSAEWMAYQQATETIASNDL